MPSSAMPRTFGSGSERLEGLARDHPTPGDAREVAARAAERDGITRKEGSGAGGLHVATLRQRLALMVRQWAGLALVFGGCIFSALFTVFLLIFDEGISRSQTAEIISLRRNSLPRSINVSAFSERLISAPPARVEIRYVVACNDCESLSFWLSEALKKAKWSVDPIIPIAPEDWVRAARSLHAQTAGITVVIDSPDKITADPKSSFGALNWALEQALGFSSLGVDTAIQGGIDVTMPPEVIRVVIAPKA